MENIKTENKSKGRGRPKNDELSAHVWDDAEHRKAYHRKYYEKTKSKTGMSKCEECGFECASNYLEKHKKTKYHLQYIARHKLQD
jgi:hypothetical protein